MTATKTDVRQFIAIFESAQVKLAGEASMVEKAMTEVIIDFLQLIEKHALDEAIVILEQHPRVLQILGLLRLEEVYARQTQEH
jgi:hypothetical protein